MATHFSYDATLLDSTDAGYFAGATVGQRNQVRLMIQDTNSARQLYQDEEIDWYISKQANAYIAAAIMCELLVVKSTGNVKSKKVGDMTIVYDTKMYQIMGAQFRAMGSGYQVPYAAGISIADKNAQVANSDAVRPAFARGMGDNPDAPKPGASFTDMLRDL